MATSNMTQDHMFFPEGGVWTMEHEEYFVDILSEHATTNNVRINEGCPSFKRALFLLNKRAGGRFGRTSLLQRFRMLKLRHEKFARILRLPGVLHDTERKVLVIYKDIVWKDIKQNYLYGNAYVEKREQQWDDLVNIFGPRPGDDFIEPTHYINISSSEFETPPKPASPPRGRRIFGTRRGTNVTGNSNAGPSNARARPPVRRSLFPDSESVRAAGGEGAVPLGFNAYHSAATSESVSSTGEGPMWYGIGRSAAELVQGAYESPVPYTFDELGGSTDSGSAASDHPNNNARGQGASAPSTSPFDFGPWGL